MNQINKTWAINGLEVECDLDDALMFEKYENAFEAMEKEEKAIPKDGKRSVFVRGYCDLYFHLFEFLFGNEVAVKLVENRYHMGQWEDVYESFLEFIGNQVDAMNERRNSRLKTSRNRAARRAAQKKKS